MVTTTLGQNRCGSDDKEIFYISQSTSITGASPSDYLMSYTGHSLRGVLPLFTGLIENLHAYKFYYLILRVVPFWKHLEFVC